MTKPAVATVAPRPIDSGGRSGRVLDPLARASEVLFGVIMALTFTTTVDAASGGESEVRTLLFAAVGCNLAWGLIDGVMYLMNVLGERGRDVPTFSALRRAATPEEGHRIITEAVSPLFASVLTVEEVERVRQSLVRSSAAPQRARLTGEDWRGAFAVFLLVLLSTFPIVIPFLVVADVQVALRTSNAIAIAMLFGCGYTLARYGGYRPIVTGLTMVVLGSVLVAITIALGG